MCDLDDDDLGFLYRAGYRLAGEWLDVQTYSNRTHGRLRSNPIPREGLLAEALRRNRRLADLRLPPDDPRIRAVQEGIDDRLEGRGPKW